MYSIFDHFHRWVSQIIIKKVNDSIAIMIFISSHIEVTMCIVQEKKKLVFFMSDIVKIS
jgi:hypothetical protein